MQMFLIGGPWYNTSTCSSLDSDDDSVGNRGKRGGGGALGRVETGSGVGFLSAVQ